MGKTRQTLVRHIQKIIFIALFSTIVTDTLAQKLIQYEKVESWDMAEMEACWKKYHIPKILAPLKHEVVLYEIMYETDWHDGSKVKASGLYFVPQNAENIPLISYNHGTRTKKDRDTELSGQEVICAAFAADGYAVMMPDYVGLGKGEKFHLYMHAETEASATIHMMYAIQELNEKEKLKLNDQLFLTGYSQGGHAAMATHRELEANYKDEFTVTASAPMSGIYDLTGVQGVVLTEPYRYPANLPYIFKSYNEIYDLFGDDVKVYKEGYDSLAEYCLNGDCGLDIVNDTFPEKAVDFVREEILVTYHDDPSNPFKRALEENNLYDWKAEAPVLLCYCDADDVALPENAIVAQKHMLERGSTSVKVRQASKRHTHEPCALFTTLYAKMWFDSYRKGKKKGKKGPLLKRFIISLAKLFV